jgi:multiple sugar transport system substrate-binding protein
MNRHETQERREYGLHGKKATVMGKTPFTGRLTRRHFVVLLNEHAAPATAAPAGPAPNFHGVTLQVSATESVYVTAFEHLAPALKAKYDITMAFDTVSTDAEYSREMLEFTSHKASHDIVLVMPNWLADYSPHLEPLEPLAKKWNLDLNLGTYDVLPDSLAYTTWSETLITLPWSSGQLQLFYNTDAFGRAENKRAFKARYRYDLMPPQTWDQYRDMAQFFATTDWVGDGKKRYGTSESWRSGLWAYNWWLARFGAYGGIPFNDRMEPLVNTAAGLKALGQMLAVEKYAIPGLATITNPQTRVFFLKGDAPMHLNFSSMARQTQDPSQSSIVGKVGITMVPGVTAGNTVYRRPPTPAAWMIGIPRYARNKDAAIHVLAYANQPAQVLEMALDPKAQINPWRLSVLDAPEWRTMWSPAYASMVARVTELTARAAMLDLMIPGSEEYVYRLGEQINLALVGQKSPKQALNDGAKAWEDITARLGRERQIELWKVQLDALRRRGIVYRPQLAT